MFFCTIPVIGFTCSFQTWGWVGVGGWNVLFFHDVVRFYPVIHPIEHITLKPYCSPKRGAPGGKAPCFCSTGSPLPPPKRWGKSTPPWHVPPAVEQEGLKTSPWSTRCGGRMDEGRTLRIKWWVRRSCAGLGGCTPRAGAGSCALPLCWPFQHLLTGALARGFQSSNDVVAKWLLSTSESWGERKQPGFFPAMDHPLTLMQRVLPKKHIFHELDKISYGLRKRLHSCECALEHTNVGGNNHWSWQEAGVVTSDIRDLWSSARMRAGVCNWSMFWDAIFPCFRQIPSGTATRSLFFREWWLSAGLRKLPITQKSWLFRRCKIQDKHQKIPRIF